MKTNSFLGHDWHKLVIQARAYAFVSQNRDTLEEKYGGKYVAIENEEIVGVYDSVQEVPIDVDQCVRNKTTILFFVSESPEPNAKMFHSFGMER